MNKATIYLIAVGFLMYSIAIDAQQRNYISMKDVIAIASKNNTNVQIAELDRRISTANYQQTDAVFLP